MEKMPRSLSDFPVDKRQHQKTAHGTVFQHDDPPKHTCSCAVTNPILRLVSLTDQKLVFQIDGPKKPPATEHVPKKIAGLVGIGGSPWGHKLFYTQGTEKKTSATEGGRLKKNCRCDHWGGISRIVFQPPFAEHRPQISGVHLLQDIGWFQPAI